jgi:hypothetical protein
MDEAVFGQQHRLGAGDEQFEHPGEEAVRRDHHRGAHGDGGAGELAAEPRGQADQEHGNGHGDRHNDRGELRARGRAAGHHLFGDLGVLRHHLGDGAGVLRVHDRLKGAAEAEEDEPEQDGQHQQWDRKPRCLAALEHRRRLDEDLEEVFPQRGAFRGRSGWCGHVDSRVEAAVSARIQSR